MLLQRILLEAAKPLLGIVFFLLPGMSSYGQIAGTKTVCPGVSYYYSVSGLSNVQWYAQNGTIVSSAGNSVYIKWTSGVKVLSATGRLPRHAGEPGEEFTYFYHVNSYSGGILTIGPSSSLTPSKPDSAFNALPLQEASGATIEFQCGPAAGAITLSHHLGSIIRWEKSYDGSSWEVIHNTSRSHQFSGLWQTTYFRAVINGAGSCTLYSDQAKVHILPLPSAPTVTAGIRCGAGSVTLVASAATGNYSWYDRTGALVNTGPEFVTPSLSASVEYWVSVATDANCASARTKTSVTINPLPAAPPPVAIENYCGWSIARIAPAPSGYTHYWQTSPTGTSTSNDSTIARVDTSRYVYVRTRNNATGCWNPAAIATAVTVYSNAPAPRVPAMREACRDVVLTGQVASPLVTYYWQTSPTGTSTTTPGNVDYKVTTTGTYYLRASYNNIADCWSAPTAVSVAVNESLSCLDGQDVNYIVTNTIRKEGVKTESEINDLSAADNARVVSYSDGFGRPMQQVSAQASANKKDVIQLISYDEFGREDKKYLPYSGSDNGRYQADALATLISFYSQEASASGLYASTSVPWAETVYEASPRNKVNEQGAPGEAWQIGKATIRKKTVLNQANEIRHWNYDFAADRCSSTTYYAAGELLGEEQVDENGNRTWRYSDKHGRVVVVKREVTATEHALTYYVYDSFSRLRMVIQPEGVKELLSSGTWSPDTTFTEKWCFTYKHDQYGRIIEKKVPGAAAVYFVYNKRNQLILRQDGEQRKKNEWTFHKYDALKRMVMSGVYIHPSSVSQSQMQRLADAQTAQFERRTSDNYSTQYGYTLAESFPAVTGSSKIYTVDYYDDYNFDSTTATTDPAYAASGMHPEPVASRQTTNKLTGRRIAVPETGQMLLIINFYDKRGNLIQKQWDNHLGGSDIETYRYDFEGKVLEVRKEHRTSGTVVKIATSYQYDHAGRVLSQRQRVNDGPPVTVASYKYNELGQLVEKKLHSVDGDTFLQQVDHRYNIRGWLSRINDQMLSDSTDLFGMELRYNEPALMSAVSAQHNGNIAEMVYNDQVLNVRRGYGFEYDRLDRVKAAKYGSRDRNGSGIQAGAYNEDNVTYDLNGNIQTLKRKSLKNRSHDLHYTYSGNRLVTLHNAVRDTIDPVQHGGNSPGYQEAHFAGDVNHDDAADTAATAMHGIQRVLDYSYDANGNLVCDRRKGITSIKYNHLNLPEYIIVQDKGEIRYTYDAVGTRLRKTVIDSTGKVTTRHYVAGFEYNNDNKLEHFPMEEGRVVMRDNTAEYQYYLKDHLGNVRVTFTATPQTETFTATFEASDTNTGRHKFLYMDEAVKVNHPLFDHTGGGMTQYAVRLNGTATERVGIGKSLSVLTGDIIKMEVFAKYLDPNRANWNTALTHFMAAVATGTAPVGTIVDGGGTGSMGNSTFPFAGVVNKSTSTVTGPKAYLNYLVFDQFYKLKNGGAVQVSENARETGNDVAHERLSKELTITEPGFVYVYLSNENDTPVEVYFDDFTVEHVTSRVVQSTDYYPFGLTFNSFSRENTIEQNYQFNGKERQRDLGLELYDFGARMYDPGTGRWNGVDLLAEKYPTVSPYNFVLNNPVRNIDPDGRYVEVLGSREFKEQVLKSLNYLVNNKADKIFWELHNNKDVTISIVESKGKSRYSPLKILLWNPTVGLVTSNNYPMSPTEILNHELAHALRDIKDKQGVEARLADRSPATGLDGNPMRKYADREEVEVIGGPEQETARQLGKVQLMNTYLRSPLNKEKKKEVTREDHLYKWFFKAPHVNYPTATEIKEGKDGATKIPFELR